jgi:tetratricopeptide (TPR) repeat protein
MWRSFTFLLSFSLSCLSVCPEASGEPALLAKPGRQATSDQESSAAVLSVASSLAAAPIEASTKLEPATLDSEKPALQSAPPNQAAQEQSNAPETEPAAVDKKSAAETTTPNNPYPAGSGVAKIYDIGEQQLKSGDFKLARETFRALSYKRPQDPLPMLKVGLVSARAGDLDEALIWTRKAVAYAPSSVDAHLQLAHLLESNQELLQAALQYETAYSCAPTGDQKVSIESAWVRALVKLQQYDKANKVCLEVLKEKRSVESLYNRAWVLSQTPKEGSKEEALRTYRKILDMDPGRHDARFNLASLLAQSGRTDEAINEFQQFIQDAPQDPDVPRAKTLIAKLKAMN